VVRGLRRTGKTSLLNVALSEVGVKSVKIDVREAPFYDEKAFMLFLIKSVRERVGGIFDKIVEGIAGVKIGFAEFSLELLFSKKADVNLFFRKLDEELRRRNEHLILAFDEAQLLKQIHFDYFLASVFDNYKSLKLVLTGSEVGLLDKLLGKGDYGAPLFGRAYVEIELGKMEKEDVMKFLMEGFRQMNRKISFEETREVIENLDGIIGWITYYGWFRRQRLSHERSIEKVKEEGYAIVKKELEGFLQPRKAKAKYLRILRYLAKGINEWASIKQAFRKEGTAISDAQLNLYLKELINYGFVEKTPGKYFVADPILKLMR